MMISAQSQPDTVVLNSAEFRFPETHPGRVFIVKKVVVNGQQNLKKSVETGNPSSRPSPAPVLAPSKLDARAEARDPMGRVLKGGEYASRLAKIQKAHKLPTAVGRSTEGEGVRTGRPEGARRFTKSEGARFEVVSNSSLINSSQDLARLEKAERDAVRRKYGALHPDFAKKIEGLESGDSVDVLIEFMKDHPGFIDGSKVSLEARKQNAAAWAKAKSKVSAGDFLQREGLVADKASGQGRVLKVRATRSKVLRLARSEEIVSIFEAKPVRTATINGPGPVDLQALLDAAYNPPETMVFNSSRDVATMEKGLSSDYVNCVEGFAPEQYDPWLDPRDGASAHSETTFHLLALGASENTLWHYATWGYFEDIVQDIIDDGIDVITTSYYMPWEFETTADSRVVDAFAYIGPYPIIVLPTANQGHDSVVLSRTFNSLVAGNVQHYNDANYTVDFKHVPFGGPYTEQVVPASQSKNPPAKYGYVDDWELPSMVAPGYSPDSWWSLYNADSCIHRNSSGGLWHADGGTSFSSPVLGAMAANVHTAVGYSWDPATSQKTRAALFVTAENVDDEDAGATYGDQRDGAGTVSGSNAVYFGGNAYRADTADVSVIDGIAYGTMDSADFALGRVRNYNYAIPSSFPSGMHLRIVLTWTSSPGVNSVENEISDLALLATTNAGIWYADRYNSNVEILDIVNPSAYLTPDGNYQISIQPWTFRKAQDGPDFLQYSVAWTWVKNHAD